MKPHSLSPVPDYGMHSHRTPPPSSVKRAPPNYFPSRHPGYLEGLDELFVTRPTTNMTPHLPP